VDDRVNAIQSLIGLDCSPGGSISSYLPRLRLSTPDSKEAFLRGKCGATRGAPTSAVAAFLAARKHGIGAAHVLQTRGAPTAIMPHERNGIKAGETTANPTPAMRCAGACGILFSKRFHLTGVAAGSMDFALSSPSARARSCARVSSAIRRRCWTFAS